MKLLHTGSLNLHEFPEDNPPRYGTLSYTWGPPADELSHRDVKDGADLCVRTSPSAHRVKLASQRAREMGYDYIWIDTLCIDQTSSAEVSEGVNASYRWISKADCCLVHLSDLPASSSPDTSCIDEEELRRCRWFRRGWTLQELVAPRQLVLYDCDWNRRGDKKTETVRQLLARVSGVEEAVLEDPACVRGISLGRRMAWAAGRLTSRPEDRAYSLLGLCGVNMPIIYGEGDRAFFRLQEEVLKNSVDLSLLLWRQAPLLGHRRRRSSFGASEDGGDGDNAAYHSSGDEDCGHTAWHSRHGDRSRGGQMFRGILARSPDEFAHITATCDYALRTPFQSDAEIQFTNKGLCARVPVVPAAAYGVGSHGGTRDLVMYVGKLTGTREDAEHYGILLRECEPGVFVRASPERIVKIPAPSGSNEGGWRKICVRRDVDEVSSRKIYAEQPDSRVNSWMADVYQGQSSQFRTHCYLLTVLSQRKTIRLSRSFIILQLLPALPAATMLLQLCSKKRWSRASRRERRRSSLRQRARCDLGGDPSAAQLTWRQAKPQR